MGPWTGLWENNINNNNEANIDTNAGAHSDQGYLLGKKKKFAPPKYPVCYVKNKQTKKKNKKNTENKQKKNDKKSASDFSTRQRSTPLLPMQLQEGFLYYTYIYVLVGKPCWSEKVSACSSVSN